jgi:pyruvate/2-oxoglutarate dehydrogenase complex dihydrolipoamide acyltransferase (E2) component
VGRIAQTPVVVEGKPVGGWRMWVHFDVDHRVTDGKLAARFLEFYKRNRTSCQRGFLKSFDFSKLSRRK